MEKMRAFGKSRLAWILAAVMAFAMVFASLAGTVYAAEGDVPAHTKTLRDNGDGTYTLSLDVVGDSEKQPNNVNVIVIFDRSGSMDQRTGGYGSQTRMAAAQSAVNSLANKLFAYNTQSAPNTVQMALVDFSTTASTNAPTNSYSTFSGWVNGLDPDGGTNWEDALSDANNINFGDDDQTFVIFVSDGNPTFRNTRGNYNPMDSYYYNSWGVYGNGSDSQTVGGITAATTIARCYDHAKDDAATIAAKVGVNNFFTIGAYGSVDRMRSLTTDAGAPAGNYYSAANTTELQNALDEILAKIEMMGIGNTEIEDGTTNQVTTTSGDIAELLEVDTSSFKYSRSGGSYGTGQAWADAPAATFANGKVDWDLSSLGVLENGVKYTVTFDCYPSQYTYDTIAKLKNGDITYASLDSEVKKYIVDNGNGSYSLRTNTNATLSYDDTRDDAGQQTVDYVNPEPVRTDSATMSVKKEWENELDSRKVGKIDMTVLMDKEKFHDVTLSADDDPAWTKDPIYISPGIIKNGKVLKGAEGHDFTFAELGSEQYNWELVAPVVHPMLIDGTLTMLTMVDDAHPAPSGADTYTINGKTYYSNGSSAASLDAYNYRRSNLNLTKVVTGEDAPKDTTFPFTLTVNNSKASSGSASDTSSDYYVWFSIYDTKAGATVKDATVTGATAEAGDTGYYYAPSGSAITVQMKDGWNLRFTNLPTGSTYTFAEGTMPTGFAFNKAELSGGKDESFSGAQTSTGTIQATNTSYTVTYTNDYQLTDLEITKVWEDSSNQDGMRPTAEAFKALLTLSPAVEGKEPAVKDNGDNTYTITYTGLPRFNNGEEVEYTVAEGAIKGYTTTGSPAKDHGTITNTHKPEEISVPVEKVWDDSNNIGGIRPTSINVQLSADGEALGDPVTLNEDNDWTYTWEKLPKFKDGVEIKYTVDETAVPTGYTKTVSGDMTGYTITNTYTPSPVTASFPVKKIMSVPEGLDGPAEWSYTIDVAANNGAPEVGTMTGTVDQDTDTVTFGPITYTAPGEYTYTVTETGTVAGVTNDEAATKGKTVTVTVTDDGTGKLTATVSSTSTSPVTFTNIYAVEPTTASFPVKKVLTVPEGLDGPEEWSYTISVAANDDAPEAGTMTGTVDQDTDTVTFGPITYNAPGEYTYTVTETGTVAGVTNDAAAETGKTVTVTVVDNGNGTLTATADSTTEKPVTFTNTYSVKPTMAQIPVEKVMSVPEGMKGPEKWSYTIDVTANDGAPAAKVMSNTINQDTQDHKVTFGDFEFTMPGTYTYKVTETGTVAGVTNDAAAATGKTVTVTVVDNGDGTLTATSDPARGESIIFTNTYSVEPTTAKFPVEKELVVPAGLEGPTKWSYTIDVKAEDGAPAAETMTGTVDQNTKTVTFGDFEYTKPGTYTYTVTETGKIAGVNNDPAATTGKTVKVTVVDNGNGTLTATADSTDAAPVKFTNTYGIKPAEASIEAIKVAKGFELKADQFSFELKDETGKALQTKKNDAAGNVKFDAISYTAPGTYKYTINEVIVENDDIADDTHTANVTVTVVDNGDGSLTATVAYDGNTFTNTHEDPEKDVVSAKDTEISVDGELVEAGDTLTYSIKYVNNTDDVATVTVTDQIPANTTYVEGSASDGGVYADGTITWTIENVAPGATGTVTFKVTVNEAKAVTEIDNTANVDDGENKSSTNAVTTSIPVKSVKDSSDASIDGEGVQVGDTLTYEIAFKLTEDATSVVVTDEVPENTTLVDGSISDGGSVSGGKITWDLGALKAGDYTVSFKVTVDESAVKADAITNTASISINNHSEVKTNTVTNTPETGALSISKAVVNGSLAEGETDDTEFTFTVELKDKNGKALTGEYTLGGDATGTITSGGTVKLKDGQTANITGLPAGATYTVTEAAAAGYTTKSEGATGTIEKEATQNAKFTNTLEVVDEISVSKAWDTNGDTTPPEGAKVTFTLYADGKATDYSVVLDGTADAAAPEGAGGYESKAWTASYVNLPKIDTATGKEIAYTVVETGTYSGYSVSGSPAQDGGTIKNTHADNVKTVTMGTSTTNIDGQEVQPGDELTYTITYNNNTDGAATIKVEDTIPAHTTYKDGSATPDATFADGKLTWTIENVAMGASGTVSFTVTVDDDVDGAELKNEAKVNDGKNDYNTNATTNPTPSEPVKDVFQSSAPETSIDGELVQPEDELLYKITYKNTTGKEANVTITDEIPEHTTYVDGSADNGGTESGGTITWNVKVANGEEITVSFKVTVDKDAEGAVLLNDADVRNGENTYKTNEVTNYTPSTPEKEVYTGSSTTNIDGQEVQPGDELTYAIKYTNTTGADADVTITDKIPAHTTFVSADNGGTNADGTVTWKLKVERDKAVTVTFKVTVDDDVNGAALYNEAKVNDGKNDYTTNETKNTTPSEPVKDVFDSSAPETSIDGKTVQVGTELLYTITYKNTTGKDATATITDKIPAHTTYVDGSADNGGTESGGTVTWTVDVAKDKSVTVSFKVKVDDEANDVTIPNTADVKVGENSYTTNKVTNQTPKEEPSEPTGEGNLEVKKELKGRKLKAGEFSFTLTPAEGAPGEKETVRNAADGTVKFSEITFRKVGEYQYKIEEVKGGLGGVTYAENSFTARAKVTADETDDTKLVVTWSIDGEEGKIAVFENTYKAEGKITLEANKELTGTNLTAGMFSFELKEGDKVLQTKTNDADGKVKFDTISYDLDDVGNKTYTIHEVDDKKDGYTYDTEDATVTVTIKDNEDGTLSAKAEYSKTTFKNTYEASGDIQLIADKTLTGRTLKDGEFSFTLTEVDEEGNVVEGGTTLTAKNEASGAVTFDKISYTMDDMVEEETEETTEAAADTAAEETTEATTEAATEAAADQAADQAAEETKETVYTKVTTPGEATTKVSYTYTDADGKEQTTDTLPEDAKDNGDGTYTVTKTVTETVTEEVADEESETGTKTVEKEVEKEVTTTYTKVEEEIPGEETVTYTYTDENGEEQTVTELPEGAKDNGDGTYTVTETVEKAAEEAAAEGEEPAAEAGAEAEEAAEEELKSYVTEKVFYYQITEDSGSLGGVTYDTHKETVKVTVTDNGDGTLTAVAEYDDDGAAFVNPYNAKGSAEFDGIKKLENHELAEGQFSFKLTDKDNKEIQTVTNGADGSFSFDEIKYTEKDAGKTFTYYITELNDNKRGYIYDSHTVEVTVEVKDNEDGTLNCKVTCSDGDKATFTNTYKPLGTSLELEALKTLKGRSLKADEFEFILRDAEGTEIETVTNAASGKVSFSAMPIDEAGTYTYKVEEIEGTLKNVTYDTNVYTYNVTVEDVDGQLTVMSIECDDEDGGETAEFVNIYTPEKITPPPTPPTPPTGDENSPVLWAVLFAAAAAAAGAVLYLRRRGRKEDEEANA